MVSIALGFPRQTLPKKRGGQMESGFGNFRFLIFDF